MHSSPSQRRARLLLPALVAAGTAVGIAGCASGTGAQDDGAAPRLSPPTSAVPLWPGFTPPPAPEHVGQVPGFVRYLPVDGVSAPADGLAGVSAKRLLDNDPNVPKVVQDSLTACQGADCPLRKPVLRDLTGDGRDELVAAVDLNTSYFGRVAYGVQAAARAYYDKDVEKLTVAEGAYLAALVQAPSQYDWAVATPTARRLVTRRWNYVLDNMVEMGRLDAGERRALRFPVPVAPQPARGLGGQAGYLVDAARNELIAAGVSEQELAAGGWTITLTIDPDKQQALERAMKPALRDADTQGAAASVDPQSGRVLALYGGRDYTKHYLSNATRADYQVGPVFLPVVTATALENKQENKHGSRQGGQAEVKDIAVALGLPPGHDRPHRPADGVAGPGGRESAADGRCLRHTRQPRQARHAGDREVRAAR